MLVVLVQFIIRLATGLALALGTVSPRDVDGGFYRVQMWVMLGLFTLASLAHYSMPSPTASLSVTTLLLWSAVGLSYVGAVLWLYGRSRAGQRVAVVITLVGLAAAIGIPSLPVAAAPPSSPGLPTMREFVIRGVDVVTSAAVLGGSMTAMLLGHWYLNSPGMKLLPLFQLIRFLLIAILARVIVVGWGAWEWSAGQGGSAWDWQSVLFLGLRWIAGLLGVTVTAWMARETLRIPNTQSATGILYVSVILAFLGELTSQLLSRGGLIPL